MRHPRRGLAQAIGWPLETSGIVLWNWAFLGLICLTYTLSGQSAVVKSPYSRRPAVIKTFGWVYDGSAIEAPSSAVHFSCLSELSGCGNDSSDKRRQVEATNCDKFVAAFCRFLPLGFEPHFFPNDFVRGWCLGANASGCGQDGREIFALNQPRWFAI
jgi:hypothetical protein